MVCLLWLRHVLDAEVETRGMARAVLDWPQFLGSSRESLEQANEQLGVVWPYWGESALADIDQFVSTDLRPPKGRVRTIWGRIPPSMIWFDGLMRR